MIKLMYLIMEIALRSWKSENLFEPRKELKCCFLFSMKRLSVSQLDLAFLCWEAESEGKKGESSAS